ncbi:MAG: hypothetical protein EHM31_04165 [Candidatus Aminicenantes bacterium]|nr:MAG: hypothetical protein EHM31_04165 [Candidatus Aminicenantes bacterium]
MLIRQNEADAKKRNRPVFKLWVRALATGLAAFVFGALYFFARQFVKDGIWRFDLTIVNKSLGTTSLFLIALSMFLTGVSIIFSKSGSKPLVYRKHHGLVGFWAGLAHGAVNHFLLPAVGLHAERKANALLSDAPGLIALAVFGAMAILSLSEVKGRVGGERWRKLLRYAGYAGLILAVAHTGLLKWESWTNFFRTFDPVLPSLSLPVALFGAAVLLLRLAAWIAGKKRRA